MSASSKITTSADKAPSLSVLTPSGLEINTLVGTKMAKKMVKLSGLDLDKDISIEITGLRPGEKLYEELLASSENTLPTHHPKIMVAKVETYSNKTIKEHLDLLTEIMIDGDVVGMVRKVKTIVPEYISQNSEFEALD